MLIIQNHLQATVHSLNSPKLFSVYLLSLFKNEYRAKSFIPWSRKCLYPMSILAQSSDYKYLRLPYIPLRISAWTKHVWEADFNKDFVVRKKKKEDFLSTSAIYPAAYNFINTLTTCTFFLASHSSSTCQCRKKAVFLFHLLPSKILSPQCRKLIKTLFQLFAFPCKWNLLPTSKRLKKYLYAMYLLYTCCP